MILTWNIPRKPNGIIVYYRLYEAGNINSIYQGLTRQFEYPRLQPFSKYEVRLEACSSAGCARTPWQSFYTVDIAPADQLAPSVAASTATSVTIQWTPPLNP